MKPILTARRGNNSELFADILRLYVPAGSVVADTTYGRGVFWKNVDCAKYEVLRSDLQADGVDARKLPYTDSSIDAVVFDPPYMHCGTNVKASIDKCYRNNGKAETWRNILSLYLDAATEAHRVLRHSGLLILKTQDTVVNHRQRWMHSELMQLEGFYCVDLFVLVQTTHPLMSGKWKKQYHARKNHSYFLVHQSWKKR